MLGDAESAPPPRTLTEILAATVAAHPQAPALDDGTVAWTYAELADRVAAQAARLGEHGIGAGDRVGIRIGSGRAELYLAILATLAAGAGYVPVDADDPDERAETVWREAGVCALFLDGDRGPAREPELRLRPDRAPSGEHRTPQPGDEAWVIFTSGSTGTPKGVAISHRAAAAFVDAEAGWFCAEAPLGPGDRVLAGLSVAFDASCEEMWLAWRHGAALVPAPRALVRSGEELGGWLLERGITAVSTVPTLAALWPDSALRGVRLLILGGEACPVELVERLDTPGREIWNTYGPTEATVVACGTRVRAGEPIRIGLPLPGWELAVLGPDGEPVGWGGAGELVISGVGLGHYLDLDRDALAYRPVPALGWLRAYHTGDRVRAEPEGLVFIGRVDDQVKIGGRRIELGEIDAALHRAPGVAAAAAAVRRTPAGLATVVGYLLPEPGTRPDLAAIRAFLRATLPAALVPALAVVDDLPTKTSGKVDRDALPWPLPEVTAPVRRRDSPDTVAEITGPGPVDSPQWLAEQWRRVLGPVPVTPDSDFFALGGSSLAAAQLASALRREHPELSVADLYAEPVLAGQLRLLTALRPAVRSGRTVRPTPRRAGAVQFAVVLGLLGYQGLRWMLALLAVENLFPVGPWAGHTSWVLLAVGWLLLIAAPGRLLTAVLGCRVLTWRVRPGVYPRGGSVHLRVWAAERVAAACGVVALAGTPWATRYARALGCRVGRGVALHTVPPVTGLLELGDGCSVESEVDLAGYWLDGDRFVVGQLRVGGDSRVGARSTLTPGAVVGAAAEVLPGSTVTGEVPAGAQWAGVPAAPVAPGSAADWPPRRPHAQLRRGWGPVYTVALFGLGLLPLVAALPALGMYGLLLAGRTATPGGVLGELVLGAVPATVLSFGSYLLLTAGLVRLAGRALRPGLHPAEGRVGFCTWLTERLTASARVTFFPLYASLGTPVWLRLLGARVGRRVEASTALLLPGLTTLDSGSFLADDALVGHPERHRGWVWLGPVEVGERAFVGNSGIVGPDRRVADGSLVGVLSSAPEEMAQGSTWLGRPPLPLPRVPASADAARTYEPPRRLVLARSAVELCRLLPLVLSLLLAEAVWALLAELTWREGRGVAVLAAPELLLLAGVLACACASAAKWLLVGRVRAGEHPLWSSFVWRNELADTFVEMLAVPWLGGLLLGTPGFNAWQRSMGARIGRGVWCDSHWLPEPDLVELGDGVSVNRGCIVQTHLFHDRVLRLDRIRMDAGATLGPHGIVLPGVEVGAATCLGSGSLVMRSESVPAGTRWLGNPIHAWADGPPALTGGAGRRLGPRRARR